MWYLLVDYVTGDLLSVSTEISQEVRDRKREDGVTPVFEVIEYGPAAPDWSVLVWNAAARSFVDRPIPVQVDRLDEFETRLLMDPDWALGWTGLNATRRQGLRDGWMRILDQLLGPRRYHPVEETFEI